eukprot:COSAG06_NODE_35018_length_465_cov_3.155738_1_plen_154_part_11
MEACVGAEVVSSCMALHTLGCRNGIALCGRVDVIEASSSVLCQWLEHMSSGGDEYEAGAASAAVHCLCGWECGPKMSPESREPIEKSTGLAMKRLLAAAGILTEQRVQEVFETGLKAGMLTHEDVSLACGWCTATFYIAYMFPAALITANDCGL